MSWGRDIRSKDLTMVPGDVEGGLEPQLLQARRRAIRAQVAARIDDYTPEWTDRRAGDPGVALIGAYGTVAEAVAARLNRAPRKVALEQLEIAGVRALQARPARAILAIEIAASAAAAVDIPAGSAFVVQGARAVPVVLETLDGCLALPGKVACAAVLADGWVVDDEPAALAALAPFGPRPRVPAELWLGIASPVAPGARLSLAVEFAATLDGATFSSDATQPAAVAPTLRWEAMTAAGPSELPVEHDGTAGLSQSGVLTLRTVTRSPWVARTLPGRPADAPLHWLRARLITPGYPAGLRLARVTLNGVAAIAARSVRDEVPEALQRSATARSRYRLLQAPVVPGSVVVEVLDASADPLGAGDDDELGSLWREVGDLAGAGPEDRVFLLDAATGELTFGDGVHGRAVPDGYRNVVARGYLAGGGTEGLPAPGDTIAPRLGTSEIDGATVLTITTGADAETPAELALRGPGQIRSRGRAVAPSDYAALALAAEGADIARAHCLPGTDPRSPGSSVPGVVGVVVLPRATAAGGPPSPSPDALRAVADHLARSVGVVGAEVVAAAPRFREVAAHAVLVAREGSDLGALGGAARDAIDGWLDPLDGFDGTGWPFGGAVRWDALTRLLLAELPELTAVSRLSFSIDGRRLAACVDAELQAGELTWPGAHVLEVVAREQAS